MIMNNEQMKATQYLKTARGQIDGIMKMLDEGRYCVDVSNQIIAAQSLLKKANMLILKQHLNHCVKDAFIHNQGEAKVDEIVDMIQKLLDI
jgi:DNA-binding FrmR family transcriptional regulator